eukprot:4184560-Pleurochrysis_carterae.AAC.1
MRMRDCGYVGATFIRGCYLHSCATARMMRVRSFSLPLARAYEDLCSSAGNVTGSSIAAGFGC